VAPLWQPQRHSLAAISTLVCVSLSTEDSLLRAEASLFHHFGSSLQCAVFSKIAKGHEIAKEHKSNFLPQTVSSASPHLSKLEAARPKPHRHSLARFGAIGTSKLAHIWPKMSPSWPTGSGAKIASCNSDSQLLQEGKHLPAGGSACFNSLHSPRDTLWIKAATSRGLSHRSGQSRGQKQRPKADLKAEPEGPF